MGEWAEHIVASLLQGFFWKIGEKLAEDVYKKLAGNKKRRKRHV